MPVTLDQSVKRVDSRGNLLWDTKYRQWQHSPRKAGSRELILRGNAYYLNHGWYESFKDPYKLMEYVGPDTTMQAFAGNAMLSRLRSESYARFRGKLYKGSASLGVTLGSWKQSREMIVKRYQQLTSKAEVVAAQLIGGNRKASQLASVHLEVIFGWMPLLQDIHNATDLIVNTRPKPVFISASSSGFNHVRWNGGEYWLNSRVNRASKVTVSNGNLWLAEKAGLLNPAAVAWDLVPWSFVVNMFVNTGQMVNSLTDFAGLSFESPTLTETHEWSKRNWNTYLHYPGSTMMKGKQVTRTFDGTARPPLVFRLPDVDFFKAAMAASLLTQKMAPVFKLMTSRNGLRYTE